MQTEIRAPGLSRRILLGASSLFLSCLLASGVAGAGAAAQSGTSRYIVQGPDAQVVAERIRALGGRVSSELPLINGVGAELTTAQARALGKDGALRLQADHAIQVASSRTSGQIFSNSLGRFDTYYPGLVGAHALHAQGITGAGVTIAVLDTGLSASSMHDLDEANAALDKSPCHQAIMSKRPGLFHLRSIQIQCLPGFC